LITSKPIKKKDQREFEKFNNTFLETNTNKQKKS